MSLLRKYLDQMGIEEPRARLQWVCASCADDFTEAWGWREFPLERPFKARLLKFCYRTAGGREDLIAFPSELGVYDGADDEAVALPNVGPLIEDGRSR